MTTFVLWIALLLLPGDPEPRVGQFPTAEECGQARARVIEQLKNASTPYAISECQKVEFKLKETKV